MDAARCPRPSFVIYFEDPSIYLPRFLLLNKFTIVLIAIRGVFLSYQSPICIICYQVNVTFRNKGLLELLRPCFCVPNHRFVKYFYFPFNRCSVNFLFRCFLSFLFLIWISFYFMATWSEIVKSFLCAACAERGLFLVFFSFAGVSGVQSRSSILKYSWKFQP